VATARTVSSKHSRLCTSLFPHTTYDSIKPPPQHFRPRDVLLSPLLSVDQAPGYYRLMTSPVLTIATLNIAAASKERAGRILSDWLEPSSNDVYVLTETSDGPGTQLLLDTCRAAGWSVFTRPTAASDRGVAIVSRVRATEASDYPRRDPAPGRCIVINLDTTPQIQVVAMYVPNRGNDPRKLHRKQAYLQEWLTYLKDASPTGQRLIVGDLNVVPPSQSPVFLPQLAFEYNWYQSLLRDLDTFDVLEAFYEGHQPTWVAHTGEGYTYDHILASNSLRANIRACRYNHDTRESNPVTDHSALVIDIATQQVERLHENAFVIPTQTELF